MPESGFTIDVDQNQYLPEGGREASAIVTGTPSCSPTARTSTRRPNGWPPS